MWKLYLYIKINNFRTVCDSNVIKNVKKGELNEFIVCADSPLPGKTKCLYHSNKIETGEMPERIDFGIMTRSRRKELGISVDLLTTGEGCR